jgi:hypothetical protein
MFLESTRMQTRKFAGITLFVLLVLGFVQTRANATVVKSLSEEDLSIQAQTILIGTCTSIRSEWNEARTKIFTYITILPQSVLKGDEYPQEVVVKSPGGIVGNMGMHVDGVSVFEEGEEVLLFLKRGRKGFYRVLGLSQGKFSVETDPDTQRKILIKRKMRRIRTRDGKMRRRTVEVKPERKIFLDEFVNRIENTLQDRTD